MDSSIPAGLGNPYDPPDVVALARPGGRLARVATVAGLGGAATLGLGLVGPAAYAAPAGSASAEGICLALREPVTDEPRAGHSWLTKRCGGPVLRPLPRPVDPEQPIADPPEAFDPDSEPVPEPGVVDGAVRVEGSVQDGVEPGCVVLRGGDGREWTLSGPLRQLPRGVPLLVDGVTAADTLSTCMQGQVLTVRAVSLVDTATVG